MEAATDYAIFTVDPEAQIQDWFPGAASVFGWSAEEIIGQPFAITFTAEDRALSIPEREFEQARQTGSAPDVRWHQHEDGSRVFIEGVVRARFDLDGEFLGALKIGRDVTERRLAEQRRIEREDHIRRELRAQVAAATVELRALSHRLLVVQEEERRALARELHDEIGQMLTGLSFTLSTAATTDGQIAEAQRIVTELTEQVRRLSMDLRPTALDSYGVLPTLRGHIERYESQTGIMVDLRADGAHQRFPAPVEITAYRIVQEALTNVARHSQASDALVQLFADEQTLTISIRDAGVGFDPANLSGATGLGGMRERAELLGGTVEIDASPGAGVLITAELPLNNDRSQKLAGTADSREMP
jgi:PAS domain S-box-containing protein